MLSWLVRSMRIDPENNGSENSVIDAKVALRLRFVATHERAGIDIFDHACRGSFHGSTSQP
jgi:hypothetical protein